MQLVGRRVQMYDPMKQKAIDRDEVIARFGVGPERVARRPRAGRRHLRQRAGRAGHRGQDRGAAAEEFGDLEDLLANAATIKQPKRRENLLEHAEQARLSQPPGHLVRHGTGAGPLDQLHGASRLSAGCWTFARQHGFRSLAQRLEPLAAASQADAPVSGRGAAAERPTYATVARSCRPRRTGSSGRPRGASSRSPARPASPNITRPSWSASRSRRRGRGRLPAARAPGRVRHAVPPASLPREEVLERLRPVLEDPAVLKIGHDLKHAVRACSPAYRSSSRRTTTRCCCPTCSTAPRMAMASRSWRACISTARLPPTRRSAAAAASRSRSTRRRSSGPRPMPPSAPT